MSDHTQGPFDLDELDGFDPNAAGLINLGSMILTATEETEVRLQLDEVTNQILAVVVVGHEAAVEVRPFAAARNGERWVHLLPQIAEAASQAGGRAEQSEGPRHRTHLRGARNRPRWVGQPRSLEWSGSMVRAGCCA